MDSTVHQIESPYNPAFQKNTHYIPYKLNKQKAVVYKEINDYFLIQFF